MVEYASDVGTTLQEDTVISANQDTTKTTESVQLLIEKFAKVKCCIPKLTVHDA